MVGWGRVCSYKLAVTGKLAVNSLQWAVIGKFAVNSLLWAVHSKQFLLHTVQTINRQLQTFPRTYCIKKHLHTMYFKHCFVAALFIFNLLFLRCSQNHNNSGTIVVTQGPRVKTDIPLKNMFGINGYEWNFLQDPANKSDASKVYGPKMALIKNFTAFRHYFDWGKMEPQQGHYTFNPANDGGWNYDAMYQHAKTDSVLMLADLKTCPNWLKTTYPAKLQNNENVPGTL